MLYKYTVTVSPLGFREMAELHRTSAAQDSKAQEAALSAEMQVREELKLAIEKQQQQHKWEMDTLNLQVSLYGILSLVVCLFH